MRYFNAMRFANSLLLLALLLWGLQSGCSNASKPEGETGSEATDATGTGSATDNNVPTTQNPPSQAGEVINKVEQTGGLSYKIYLQPTANSANRKGIILFGSGDELKNNDPVTGNLEGPLENNVANELAKLGYVAAIVAYRDQPPIDFKDGGKSWNSNSEMMATDMSQVANAIIATYGGGLNRSRVVTGGMSYAAYSLLTNLAMDNTPLADTRGFLATCGATGDFEAKNFKRPIFSLNCSGNLDGDFNGQALIDKITNPTLKADSGYFTDPACNSHCGGSTGTWTAKLVERTQLWLP